MLEDGDAGADLGDSKGSRLPCRERGSMDTSKGLRMDCMAIDREGVWENEDPWSADTRLFWDWLGSGVASPPAKWSTAWTLTPPPVCNRVAVPGVELGSGGCGGGWFDARSGAFFGGDISFGAAPRVCSLGKTEHGRYFPLSKGLL